MGKERRKKRTGPRHDPLGRDITRDRLAVPQKRHKHGPDHEGDDFMDVATDGFVPEAQSRKIFRYARQLQDDEEAEAEQEAKMGEEGEADIDPDVEEEEDVELEFSETMSQKSQFTDLCSMPDIEAELDPEDERILNELMPQSFVQSRNLADLIMEKIREKEQAKAKEDQDETASQAAPSEAGSSAVKFDPKVVRVYTAVGKLLGKFRSGKLPKALKILPHLQHWEELLLLTKPHNWTPHAMYQVTRIFAANLNERMAQRFYNAVLLPSVRARMRETPQMPPHYYMAIRKAMFKQRAFLKGFLLPLCEEGNCGLREAMIVGSVLQKSSLKVINAAVALAKIALMPYSGACSLFLRILIDKQFSLPLGCIDALVQHFGSQLRPEAPRELPVLWHQSLLTFLQRYKNDLTPEQVELIRKVVNRHSHYLITSEIRRELLPLLQRSTAHRPAGKAK